MAALFGILILVGYPTAAFFMFRVLLSDPRKPAIKPSLWLTWGHVILVTLPVLMSGQNKLTPFIFCLAVSSVFTPMAFSAMRTEGWGGWFSDKIFLSLARMVVALVLGFVLVLLPEGWWVIVLLGLGFCGFFLRLGIWLGKNGSPGRYFGALGASAVVIVGLSVAADRIAVTAKDWFKALKHLPPTRSVGGSKGN